MCGYMPGCPFFQIAPNVGGFTTCWSQKTLMSACLVVSSVPRHNMSTIANAWSSGESTERLLIGGGGAKLRPKNHPAHWYPAKITSGVGTNSIAISSFQTHTYSVYTIQTIVIRSDALSQASESALASWVVAETGCPPSGSTSNEKSSSLGPPSAPRPTGSPPGALWRKGGTRPGLRGPRSP